MSNPEQALALATRAVSAVFLMSALGAAGWWYANRPVQTETAPGKPLGFSERLEAMQNHPGVQLRETDLGPRVQIEFHNQ
jgi:hypothetical protein